MNEPLNDKALRDALLAVADGEADAAQRERAFAAMAELPELARFVFDQQRLRAAVKRTMGDVPSPAAAVRDRIEAQLKGAAAASSATPAPSTAAPSTPPQQARLAPWLPTAIAALLCIVAGSFFVASRQPADRAVHPLVQNVSQVIPADEADNLAGRHVACSRLIASLDESTKFPSEIKDVPKAIGEYLGRSPYGALDLSALGFKFEGAGPCSIPGSPSVHLIFRPIDRAHRDDALSLWVQPDNGSVQIKSDTMYQPSGEYAVHPIVLWKHADMVYYLVGDEAEMVTKAAQKLASQL